MEMRVLLRRMEKRVVKLERRAAKLERENKALRAGQAELLEAVGQISSAFAQGGVAHAAVEICGRKKKRRKLLLTDLPADVVQHIVVRLTLAHDIARAAPTCRAISVAARNAFTVRPFFGGVVTLAGHRTGLRCVASCAPSSTTHTG